MNLIDFHVIEVLGPPVIHPSRLEAKQGEQA